MSGRAPARSITPAAASIVPATDLGSVEVAKHGNLYLLTDPRGDVRIDGRGLGLYELDTRILSTSMLRLYGAALTLLRGPYLRDGVDTIQLTNPELRRNPDDKRAAAWSLAHRELSVTRTRRLDGELREQVTVVNYSAGAEDLELDLGLGVDMADIFEVRGYPRLARGTLLPVEIGANRAEFGYEGLDGIVRTTTVAFDDATLEPVSDPEAWPGASVLACWRVPLASNERASFGWTVSMARRPRAGGGNGAVQRRGTPSATAPSDARVAGPGSGAPVPTGSPVPPPLEDQLLETPRIDSDHEILDRTLRRSLADLAMLRNHGPAEGESYLAAGVPWFATLFGRDSLIAALELVAFYPRVAADTLTVLARLQATTDDPWHDAEPGKILHELRTGEMAGAGETPHDAYYGSVDSTPLWLIVLGEVHAWTGDDELLERLWPNALAALDWIDRYGDLDGDGFVEYRRRSRLGLLNQGWKDSGDAIRHTDGRPADAPIALAEVQGYVYSAKRAMARLSRHRGDAELGRRLDAAADRMRDQFDAAFWVEEAGFYAMALDGAKRPVASIGSNVGQALWSGIVPAARAARVADRLLAPDLFSGWGIRTFAAGQPGYNPVGYHTGSIWPHDNALIAAGLKAVGSADGANLIAGRLIEAAQWFPDLRLPELFCGFARDEVGAPVAYPVACSPQAWAAATPFFLLKTMLGLRADATGHRIELDRPTLPEWLTKLTITGLPIGGDSVDLLIHRWRGRTSAELLGRRGSIDVLIHA
jgi:glycogen debranching enzyme